MSGRTAWILCLIAGVVLVGLTVLMGAAGGVRACDGATSLDPMIRFEWVRTVDEVRTLFGEEPCRSSLAAAMDRMNRIDVLAYIPAFTLFQIFAALALRGSGRGVAIAAIAAAIVAAICDQWEDQILLAITGALPGEQPMIDRLFWLVRIKFALLAFAAACLGLLLTRSAGATRWLGMAMILGAVIALAGLAQPQLLTPGIALAWAALLITAAVRVIRPSSAASFSPQT